MNACLDELPAVKNDFIRVNRIRVNRIRDNRIRVNRIRVNRIRDNRDNRDNRLVSTRLESWIVLLLEAGCYIF